MTARKVKLTVRNYFSQRPLDADSRFAKDIEYLLPAQQLTATKDMKVLCFLKLKEDCTKRTARAIKQKNVIEQLR